ncbi:MAG: class I SAM-dependent methyltransferase [Candidatus Woesearchaeota archaeon]
MVLKKIRIETQYDGSAKKYAQNIIDYNKESRELFFTLLPDIVDKDLLDIGCGNGSDAKIYSILGAKVTGIDASKDMIALAKQEVPDATFIETTMEDLLFEEEFDVITSKYAIQTSKDIDKVYLQINKALKPKGTFIMLVTHPLRQFLEKQGKQKDYFKKEIVKSTIFENKIELHEPSHTFNEYLSPFFLKNFDIQYYFEREEFPGAKRMDGHNYPCYLIIKAVKRGE